MSKYSFFVCKSCHDTDKLVVGCNKPFDSHPSRIRSNCDVCGKQGEHVVLCFRYAMKAKENEDVAFLKNICNLGGVI